MQVMKETLAPLALVGMHLAYFAAAVWLAAGARP
jgi:hypothetical protein